MAKKIFIAATGQHKGKTTCTLGIAAALKAKGLNVGYCKPVGQNHIMVNDQMIDKDVVLFESILQFKTEPEIHSPVVIASGVTTEFIQNPAKFNFKEQILSAARHLEAQHDIIVYEGTGHVGVGSIVGLSNAQVAQILDTEVILVAEGGIGSTFDRLNMNLALFRELKIPVKGVLINKVHPDKLERVTTNITLALSRINIPVLGVLPYDKALSFPLMSTINKSIGGTILLHPEELDNQVEDILAGSLIEIDEFTYFQNLVLIVTFDDFQSKIEKIQQTAKEKDVEESPLSGVILTGFNKRSSWSFEEGLKNDFIRKHKIPVLATDLDTYDTVVAISQIEVKINMQTPWKVQRAIELIQANIDIENLY